MNTEQIKVMMQHEDHKVRSQAARSKEITQQLLQQCAYGNS